MTVDSQIQFDFGDEHVGSLLMRGQDPPDEFPLEVEPTGAKDQGYFEETWGSLDVVEKYAVYRALWEAAVARLLVQQIEIMEHF